MKMVTLCPCVCVFSLCFQAMTFPSYSRKFSWWRNARTRILWLTLGATSGRGQLQNTSDLSLCALPPPLPWSRSQTFDTSESPVSSTQRAAAWNRHNTCDYWVTPVCESMTQAWTGPTGARVGTSVPGCFSHVSNWACILWLISSSRFNRNQGLWCLLYSCYFRETQVLSQQACLATLSTKGYCENVNEPPKCAWFLKKK